MNFQIKKIDNKYIKKGIINEQKTPNVRNYIYKVVRNITFKIYAMQISMLIFLYPHRRRNQIVELVYIEENVFKGSNRCITATSTLYILIYIDLKL